MAAVAALGGSAFGATLAYLINRGDVRHRDAHRWDETRRVVYSEFLSTAAAGRRDLIRIADGARKRRAMDPVECEERIHEIRSDLSGATNRVLLLCSDALVDPTFEVSIAVTTLIKIMNLPDGPPDDEYAQARDRWNGKRDAFLRQAKIELNLMRGNQRGPDERVKTAS